MTLKEAKKILKKEGFIVDKIGKPQTVFDFFIENEAPDICEAMQVVSTAGYDIYMEANRFDARKARLKKEHEENTKAPGSAENSIKGDLSGNKSIEHCGELIPGPIFISAGGIKFNRKYNQNISENPALEESASQFNDALLDEQAKEIESLRDKCKKYADILDSVGDKLRELKAENRRIKNSDLNLEGLAHATRELKEKYKKIVELTDENERLKDQVAVLYECKENNEKYNLKQIKRLGKEITRLNKAIHKKNMNIEELRKESSRHLRGKIKVFYENVDLEKMLKDKNAVLSDVAEELRLSKIREKNLTEVCQKYMKENEELREKLANKIVDKIDAQALKSAESALAYKEKVIAEKDEVIADLGKELKEKHKKYVWYKGAYDAAQQILNTIADYASKHPDKKFSDQMVGVDIAEEGADLTGVIIIKSEK
ncbi:coiled-coil domain-containing protein [Prevotella sp. Sow4_E9_plate]|uniref:coiled-coil domain-containing protein n=1 Tax=Prevotella sp. Sow4_E9_plate TaxID=3438802 RepID=UPI003F948533